MKDEIRWTKRNKIDSLKFIVKIVSFFPLFTPLDFHVKRDERAIITREVAVTGRSYQRGRKREAVRSSRPDSESVKPADPIPRLTVRIKFVHPAHNDCNMIHSPLSEFRDRALRHFPVSNSLPSLPTSRVLRTFIRTRPNTIHLTSSGVSPSNCRRDCISLAFRIIATDTMLCAHCVHALVAVLRLCAINFNPRNIVYLV